MFIKEINIMADGQKKSGNDIDQIRNLIFGEHIELIQKKFESMQKQIEKINKKISENMRLNERKFTEFKNQSMDNNESIQGNIQKLSSELDKQIENLRKEILAELMTLSVEKTNKDLLAEFFIELGNRIKDDSKNISNP